MIPLFAFNNESYHYAIENFYPEYQCRWQPTKIPALTIASEQDYICPPHIFINDSRFQTPNITNKLINQAGHCPWINHLEQIQICFDEFIEALYKHSP